jgi:hypothetical protein
MRHKILNDLYDAFNAWAMGVYSMQDMSMKVMDTALALAVDIGIDPDNYPVPEDVQ